MNYIKKIKFVENKVDMEAWIEKHFSEISGMVEGEIISHISNDITGEACIHTTSDGHIDRKPGQEGYLKQIKRNYRIKVDSKTKEWTITPQGYHGL